jgi:hypothetical protein
MHLAVGQGTGPFRLYLRESPDRLRLLGTYLSLESAMTAGFEFSLMEGVTDEDEASDDPAALLGLAVCPPPGPGVVPTVPGRQARFSVAGLAACLRNLFGYPRV